MEIDRRAFLDSLGGAEAVNRMDSEARADALEHHMLSELNRTIDRNKSGDQKEAKKYPTAAEVEAQIETRPFRQCAGFLVVPRTGENVKKLPPMPARPTLLDFFSAAVHGHVKPRFAECELGDEERHVGRNHSCVLAP